MSTTPPAATPAGWYNDPSGSPNLRYWDGAQWTEHTGALPPQQAPADAVQGAVDSVANAFQNAKGSEVVSLPVPYQQAFDATAASLPAAKMTLRSADPQTGVIVASTGMSLTSWGEDVTIRLAASDDGASTNLWMESKMKFGLVNWGKHDQNFNNVVAAVQRALHGGGPAAPPQQPPQPPSPA
jgi:hypothetical protein